MPTAAKNAVFAFQRSNDELANLGALKGFEKPASFTSSFKLSRSLWVRFEETPRGEVVVESRKDADGLAHLHVEPRNLGPSRWFRFELALDVNVLNACAIVIPVIEAASAKTVSANIAVRMTRRLGRYDDIGSTELEIRHLSHSYAFPIDLQHVSDETRNEAMSASLIAFIQARNAAIDLYSLQIFGVRR